MFIKRKNYEKMKELIAEKDKSILDLKQQLASWEDIKENYEMQIKDLKKVKKTSSKKDKTNENLEKETKNLQRNMNVLRDTLISIKTYCEKHKQSPVAKDILNEIKLEEK